MVIVFYNAGLRGGKGHPFLVYEPNSLPLNRANIRARIQSNALRLNLRCSSWGLLVLVAVYPGIKAVFEVFLDQDVEDSLLRVLK